jgi:hypothetical protein
MAVSLVHYPYAEGRYNAVKETVPGRIPSVSETLFSQDCWLQFVCLTNTHSVSVNVTVSDRQGTPLPVISAAPIAAGETLTIPFWDRLCPSGLMWLASVDGVVIGYLRAKI